jgi:hypothetical protein
MTTSSTGGDGDKVVRFPKTPEERRALRKAKEALEKQRLVNTFIDQAGGDKALFHSPDGVAYADVIVNGHRETWPVRSKPFCHAYLGYLQRQLDRLVSENQPLLAIALKAGMSKASVNHAIDDFERRAICSITRDVHVHVAGGADEVYLDLCSADWACIRVTATGWSIVDSPPVRFRRTNGMLPLPIPERGGKIEALRPFLNATDSDFTLAVGYLLAALFPRGPYPVLIIYGEQGSAKTAFLRKLRSLVDPHVVMTAALPLSAREFFIAAQNSHMQAFENISKLSDSMSDHLCRLATGGGLRTRKLFKDTDEVFFSGARPIALEGISNIVSRPDLQSRAIVFRLESLTEYLSEDDLEPAFDRLRPAILGALLDLVRRGLEMLPATQIVSPSRMALFTKWAVACGLDGFEPCYRANLQSAVDVMLAHDSLAKAVRALVAEQPFAGSMEDLLDVVGPVSGIRSTRKLSDELRRLAPALRSVGVVVTFEQRRAEYRGLRIELQK